jgi:RimJ/RimL family protein N-acetyltransferase
MEEYYQTLKNSKISLVPLTPEHIESLTKVCGHQDIWKWFTLDLSEPDRLKKWMYQLLDDSTKGNKMTFAVRLNDSNQIIGSTSYGNIEWKERNIEIGWTWIGKDFIGAGINKHMKFLMLNHAFEQMKVERLELRTDELNVRSRKAMEKIGAKHDASLRYHRQTRGGRRRTTVVYSIIRPEWSKIKNTIFKEF